MLASRSSTSSHSTSSTSVPSAPTVRRLRTSLRLTLRSLLCVVSWCQRWHRRQRCHRCCSWCCRYLRDRARSIHHRSCHLDNPSLLRSLLICWRVGGCRGSADFLPKNPFGKRDNAANKREARERGGQTLNWNSSVQAYKTKEYQNPNGGGNQKSVFDHQPQTRLDLCRYPSHLSPHPNPLEYPPSSPPSSPDEDAMMFNSAKTFVKVGIKRKRSVSGAENATFTAGPIAPQRATRGAVPRGSFKRQKSESILGVSESDEDLDETLPVSTSTADTLDGYTCIECISLSSPLTCK